MTSQQHVSAPRTNVLAVLGMVSVAVGGSLAFAIWYSSFALYMHVENFDLGLDEATTSAITRITPTERGLVIVGGALVVFGLIASQPPPCGASPRAAAAPGTAELAP